MKILFLDDNESRYQTIRRHIWPKKAKTAAEAIYCLQTEQYDAVFLDHDLGDEENVPSDGVEETGYTVAKWIVENKPSIPLIVVHSCNHSGARNMATILARADYRVVICPFTQLPNKVAGIMATLEEAGESDAPVL